METFRGSIATIDGLPCDTLLSVQPGFADLTRRLQSRNAGAPANPFLDGDACRRYEVRELAT